MTWKSPVTIGIATHSLFSACGVGVINLMNRNRQAPLPKQAFAISRALRCIRTAVHPYAPAALFELADESDRSPCEQLVAWIISIRTHDETNLPIARRLFAQAPMVSGLVQRLR